jgi:hypothetical protein
MCASSLPSDREYLRKFVTTRESGLKHDSSTHILDAVEEFVKWEKHPKGFERFLNFWSSSGTVKILVNTNIEDLQSIPILQEYHANQNVAQKGGCTVTIAFFTFAVSFGSLIAIFTQSGRNFTKFILACVALISLYFLVRGISLVVRENNKNLRSRRVSIAGKSFLRTSEKLEPLSEVSFPQPAPVIHKLAFDKSDLEECPVCLGRARWSSEKKCDACNGTGRIKQEYNKDWRNAHFDNNNNLMIIPDYEGPCSSCKGTGTMTVKHVCSVCRGEGSIRLIEWVDRYNKEFAIPFNKRLEKLRPFTISHLDDLNQKIRDLNERINVWNSKIAFAPPVDLDQQKTEISLEVETPKKVETFQEREEPDLICPYCKESLDYSALLTNHFKCPKCGKPVEQCNYHETAAVARCSKCGRYLCEKCTYTNEDRTYCKNCYSEVVNT